MSVGSPSSRVCSCDTVQLRTDSYVPYKAGGVYFNRKSTLPFTHVTRYMNTPHCLLGAGWPGPTLAPALSNTRCRSLSAAGAGGCGVCVCLCVRVCVLVGRLWCFVRARVCLYGLTKGEEIE